MMGGSNNLEQYAITNEGSKNDWYWRVGLQKDIIGSYKDGHGVRIPQPVSYTHLDVYKRQLEAA